MNDLVRGNRRVALPNLLGQSLFNDFFGDWDVPTLHRRTIQGYPVADIFTDGQGNTQMEFALAGFSKEEISIEVQPDKNSITVRATTGDGDSEEEGNQPSRRIARRSFEKTYVNHDANLDLTNISAQFTNGLLQVTVPPRAELQPIAIEIK